MTIAFLNGEFLPLEEARISPMDRGFLFGDGVYEVIPSYQQKMVGFNAHMQRMQRGLEELEIKLPYSSQEFKGIIDKLISSNIQALESQNIGVYIQISRGADSRRFHAYPKDVKPTVFAFTYVIPAPVSPDRTAVKGLSVVMTEDRRWQRCHIKSTSLLGNVMHFEQGQRQGKQETLLFNGNKEVTEASASNVFIVEQGIVKTPPLDYQKLPGITRQIVISSLRQEGVIVEEQAFDVDRLLNASEVWLTSSTKEIAPVTQVDDRQIGNGKVGDVWERALRIYNKYKFTY